VVGVSKLISLSTCRIDKLMKNCHLCMDCYQTLTEVFDDWPTFSEFVLMLSLRTNGWSDFEFDTINDVSQQLLSSIFLGKFGEVIFGAVWVVIVSDGIVTPVASESRRSQTLRDARGTR
jgi:hypothetical protein